MAQGDVLLNDDGTVALNGAGLVRLVDVDSDCPDCCDGCTASATSCTNCDDVTPSQYEVTFDGVNLCVTCYEYKTSGEFYTFSWNAGDVLNAAHTLTQNGSCDWTLTLTNAVAETHGSSCPTSTVFGPNDLTITLTRGATDWTLRVAMVDSANVFGWNAFYDVRTANTDGATQLCATVPSFSSDIAACADIVDGDASVATGGTATVVCL